MKKLRLYSLTFVNPETGEKAEAILSEKFQLEFEQPLCNEDASANFLSGAIVAGSYDSTKKFHSKKD